MKDILGMAAELRQAVGKLRRRLREEAPGGELTWSQIAVLGHIARNGPMTVTDLAHAEGMRSQSMGAIVAALQLAGMLRGEPDPQDGRKTQYHCTPRCDDFIRANRALRDDWLATTIDHELSAEEQQLLQGAIGLLQRIAGSTRPRQ
ncbi:MarR family transcriptional regulator [Erwinia sp. OLTSP20]|uniref:MarR family winged helix-turn-helix transcriptional regulator n=1 Tax=unclassified Erwinia TaxID=2622719 RepID=UPI000C18A3FA|nr:MULTISPECIES: MarR family transcriptional regulator [unclassified Erwinia]PIJ51178.1 MarR family transcriptional regulator [Erwinia sp. OAMSP11]PIJ73930.1 MarR family transcriptional regulator [Erwinia sp. OLSSP12]PIJ83938.1 MarR family transcriptional regulator [Erwinia sp. OLCASP19]PIJ86468.1 MarR family transcriptional regulator [Erwinia sp. OLMTSP26]PIJ87947.1 MarR family transcriptional regulator [Erwinia sp. OLMDSP33]